MGYWENQIGASDEWYTPKYIFDALGCTFDLDVAAPRPPARTHVPARGFAYDSLEDFWDPDDFIWMNPPFGGRNGIVPWLDKFFAQGNGIALVADRTSAPWFQKAGSKADLILFLSPKVKFERPDGSTGSSPANGTALLSVGARGRLALVRAATAGLGLLVMPGGR